MTLVEEIRSQLMLFSFCVSRSCPQIFADVVFGSGSDDQRMNFFKASICLPLIFLLRLTCEFPAFGFYLFYFHFWGGGAHFVKS